jgi:hypothetical protein
MGRRGHDEKVRDFVRFVSQIEGFLHHGIGLVPDGAELGER